MEQGILFSRSEKPIEEGHKMFCFAEIQRDSFWDKNDPDEVSRQEALYFDAIDREILSKYV